MGAPLPLQEGRRMRRSNILKSLFRMWKHGQPAAHECNLRVPHDCWHLRVVARHRALCRRLRQELCQSKRQELRRQLESLLPSTTAAEVLRRLKPFTGPTNPKKRKQKALPLVKNETGEVCQLPCEALGVWIRFFQEMEAGKRMSLASLKEIWISELQDFRQPCLDIDMTQVPSLTDLECALRRVPRGKAHGPDGLPGELCHHQAAGTRLLYPLILKALLHGQEPISFKGGLLTPAYKGKGPADCCRSYRSLLVSNHLGKAVHRTIRQHYAPLQTGGRRKTPVQLPQHQVRAFARHAKAQGQSTGILYLDLVEAFYRVLREVPMGGTVSEAGGTRHAQDELAPGCSA